MRIDIFILQRASIRNYIKGNPLQDMVLNVFRKRRPTKVTVVYLALFQIHFKNRNEIRKSKSKSESSKRF